MPHPNDLKSSQQRLGGLMVIIGWILAIALLTFLLQAWHFDREAPKLLVTDGGGEITIQRDYDGHFRLDGHINDVEVTFMVDTGATRIAVPAFIAAEAHMVQKAAITIHTANGPTQGYLSQIENLEFENVVLKNIPAIISPSMHQPEVLLGMNVLSKFVTTQTAETLRIQFKH